MTRRAALMAASFAAVACPCCEALASGGAVFEYGSLSGPQAWGGVCRTGARQSPIDVPRKALAASLKARGSGAGAGACRPAQLNTSGYKAVKPTILNTGVGTMQVNYPKGSNILLCGGSELELLQFHFHTPSEHAFDGERTAMEVHLVHKNTTTGQLGVLGILMETPGTPNPGLAAALKYAPAEARKTADSPLPIDPRSLLPRAGGAYIRYSGSLTTPGCNEGVEWYVMLDTVTISPEQALQFASYVSGGKSLAQNSRPLQPLNGRAFDLQYDCT